MSNVNQTVIKKVSISDVLVDEDMNARRCADEKKLAELEGSIRDNGLKEPPGVVNGGEGAKPYTLTYGYRRFAVLKKLGFKEIDVVVSKDAESAPIDNLIENMHREDVDQLDVAQRVLDLTNGDYHVPKGQTAKKWTEEELMQRLGKSKSHIQNLIRIAKNLQNPVRRIVEGRSVPSKALFAWASMTKAEKVQKKDEKGKPVKDEKGKPVLIEVRVPDVDKQVKAAKAFVEERKQLEEQGLSRKPRSDKGGKQGKKSGGKKSAHADDFVFLKEPAPADRKSSYIYVADYIEVMQQKLAEAKGNEAAELKGAIDMARFITGQIKRCPYVTEAEIEAATDPEPEQKSDKAAE